MLQRLIYLSVKTDRFTNSRSIAEQSKTYNCLKGISGILLEYKNNFIQYLEGDPLEVYSLFKRIEKDDRHKEIWLVDYSAINQRVFTEWGMGFKQLNKTEIEALGFDDKRKFEKPEDFLRNTELMQLIQMIEFAAIKPG